MRTPAAASARRCASVSGWRHEMSVIQSSVSRPGAGSSRRRASSISLLLAKTGRTSAPSLYRATATAAAVPSRQLGPWLTTRTSFGIVAIDRLWPIGPRAGSERSRDASVVDDAVALGPRERRQAMRVGAAAARDVEHLDAADDEEVRDELAVAAPGHG